MQTCCQLILLALLTGLGGNVEENQARDLIAQADIRISLGDEAEGVAMYKSVLDRFPKAAAKYTAHLRLGRHYHRKGNYQAAVDHLHRCAEGTAVEDELAEAFYLKGACYFEQKEYEKAFTELRKLTVRFPGSEFSNRAFYQIGEGHFRLKDYNRAIEALQMVGTSIPPGDPRMKKLAPGERLFISLADDDLRVVARRGESIDVTATAASGDSETINLTPIGIGGNQFVGSIATRLGEPAVGDGTLDVVGGDRITVTYADSHTAAGKRDVPVIHDIEIAQDAKVNFLDGVFTSRVRGVSLGRNANIGVRDGDRDTTAEADTVEVVLRVKRPLPDDPKEIAAAALEGREPENRYDLIDEMKLTLTERGQEKSVHSGLFGAVAAVSEGEPDKTDDTLHAQAGDVVEIEYLDERGTSFDDPVKRTDEAVVVAGTLSPMKAFDSLIQDKSLRVRTELRVASALTEMGLIYKDLGLRGRAYAKLDEALLECGKVAQQQAVADRDLLEECQYLLWRIYFAKDQPQRAADVCLNLLRNFPNSEFADDALMSMGEAAQKQGDYPEAISMYRRLLKVENTSLQPDAQFRIAECYEARGKQNASYYEAALKEYRVCVEKYPESRFASESIVKIANFYYELDDFPRAIEIYDKALRTYPDARFIDLILLNYGKCLFKMRDYSGAAAKFDLLVQQHPQSEHVEKAKLYADHARQRSARGGAR